MAAQPVTLSATLSSAASAEEVMVQLRRLPLGSAPRIIQPDSKTLLVSSGSRLRYRLLGMWSARQHLPLTLRFQLAPHGGDIVVKLTLTSDAGWYLVQTPMGRQAYRARFVDLLTAMKAHGMVKGG